jgi:hypothetical protein
VCSSLTRYWRERAVWLLVNAYLREMQSVLSPKWRVGWDGDGECSLSALKDRSSVDLTSLDFYRTNRPPCIGRGAGLDS